MVALILAAGYATRLYPLTLNQPKPLLKIGDKTILDYIVDSLDEIDCIQKTIVITNDKFHTHFLEWAKGRKSDAEICVLNDGTLTGETRLGAIGDIYFAIQQEQIDDELLVIAGDNFFTYKLLDFYRFYRKQGKDAVVVKEIQDREALKSLGVAVVDDSGRVLEFEEKPKEPRSNLAVYASYLYQKDTVSLFKTYLEEGNKPDAPGNFAVWLAARKPLLAYQFSGECYDIGTPESYRLVCEQYGGGAGSL